MDDDGRRQGEKRTVAHASEFQKVNNIQDPGITLLRYNCNVDGLTSKKWFMYNHNADKNGQQFWKVQYYMSTNGTVSRKV
jgi:hypothetical protein